MNSSSCGGEGNSKISSPEKYHPLMVADNPNPRQFKADLKAHQEGKTNYPTFFEGCAKSGIEKWVVDIDKMT